MMQAAKSEFESIGEPRWQTANVKEKRHLIKVLEGPRFSMYSKELKTY